MSYPTGAEFNSPISVELVVADIIYGTSMYGIRGDSTIILAIDGDPLGISTLNVTGILTGSEVRLYDGSGNEFSGGVESASSSNLSFTYNYYSGMVQYAYLVILLAGYHPRRIPVSLVRTEGTMNIQMQPDGAYEA